MQIYPDYTIFIQFFQFLILLILFNFLLFRPVLNAFKKRQAAIDSLSAKAEDNRHEAEGLGKTYDEQLKGQKLPVMEERDALLKQAASASMKMIEEARQELAEELVKVKDSVKAEADRALEALKVDSDRLASEVVEKIMKRGK
jgi:F-type H+-transporting ATPase subunit b